MILFLLIMLLSSSSRAVTVDFKWKYDKNNLEISDTWFCRDMGCYYIKCFIPGDCYDYPCIVANSPAVGNETAWSTMDETHEMKGFQFRNVVTGQRVVIDRHMCLSYGKGPPEWPPR